jgi:hypothetical protein
MIIHDKIIEADLKWNIYSRMNTTYSDSDKYSNFKVQTLEPSFGELLHLMIAESSLIESLLYYANQICFGLLSQMLIASVFFSLDGLRNHFCNSKVTIFCSRGLDTNCLSVKILLKDVQFLKN